MHILILGAAGMLGRKLTERLIKDGHLNGKTIEQLTLVDVATPEAPKGFTGILKMAAADFSAEGQSDLAIQGRPDVIYHLAAVVSGEAERDFEKGYRVNLAGTLALFESIRTSEEEYKPNLIYASSGGVFGAPFPSSLSDDFHLTPHSSYGTQKAICELLLADYVRKGFLKGIGLRLPTISVRPGKPNAAATGFFSSIIREPLAGQEAVLPVPDTVTHTHASPRSAVGFLIHAASLRSEDVGQNVNLTMPGINCTVGDQIAALERIAGKRVADRIRRQPDDLIRRIVGVKPRVEAKRALDLGFKVEERFEEIIVAHIQDELNGRVDI